MKTRAELKAMAKEQIKGNVGILFVITLIIAVLSGLATAILSLVPVFGSLAAMVIVTPAFAISILRIYLNLTQGKKPEIADSFSGFNDFFSAFKVTLLVGIFTFLWSLLFYIPGIIKGISYSQALYIVAENPGMGAREAISRSKEMMHGRKMDFFVLGLSFLGWSLLGVITLGIAYIWVVPYMQATLTNFYNDIKPVEVVESVAEEVAADEPAAE
jgi:uncharacterized membrane protein